MIAQYTEKMNSIHSSTTSLNISQPPPTIWNVNTQLNESDLILPCAPLKPYTRQLEPISEVKKKKIEISGQSRTAIPYECTPPKGTFFQSKIPKSDIQPKVSPFIEINEKQKSLKNTSIKSNENYEEALREKAATTIQLAYRMHARRRKKKHTVRIEQEPKKNYIEVDKRASNLAERTVQSHYDSAHSTITVARTSVQTLQCHSKSKTEILPSKSVSREHIVSPIVRDYLREGSLFFAERESVLVFGGIDPHSKYGDGKNTGRNIFRYNSEINQWDLVGELPQPRHHHAVACIKGKVYLAGGTDPRDDNQGKTVVVGTVWSFDPVSRAWYKESEMLTPRKNFGLAVMNGKLLAIGGQDKNGRILSSVERYDPETGVWEFVARLNTERTGVAATKYNGTVWVAGGMTGSKRSPLTAAVEYYDSKSDAWIEQPSLRFPKCFGCLFSMNNTLYFIGGAGRTSEKEKTTSSCNSIDLWNPKEKEWKLHFAMSIPRHGHAVAYLGTQILIIGGVTTAYLRALTDIECFCCERKTWVRGLTGLPVPLSGHGAVTLPPASLM